MIDNLFKDPSRRRDDSFRDPRREKERKDFELMPKGKTSIANLDPNPFYQAVRYQHDKTDGAN